MYCQKDYKENKVRFRWFNEQRKKLRGQGY